MLNSVCNLFLWLFGLAPSNLGLQELNSQLRYGQYHLPMGVDGLASLAYYSILKARFACSVKKFKYIIFYANRAEVV